MAVSDQAIRSGQVTGDCTRIHGLLLAGIQRLSGFQDKSGMFAIWCGGTPNRDITARVAHRLMALRELPYEEAHRMLHRATRALLTLKHKDNQLLPLDARFRDTMRTVKDAVSLYFAEAGERDQALDHLRRTVHRNGKTAHWKGKTEWGYWGGDLEATCDATRVMLHAGDPLFHAGFNHVGSQLVNGMLHSTADTRALVELLAMMQMGGANEALVDGSPMQLSEPVIAQEVQALSHNLIVRVDEELLIDWLHPRHDFAFDLKVEPRHLALGQRAWVTITLKEDTICPLARIYLPGCLALLQGGANAQTAHLPVGVDGRWFRDRRQLELDVVAVRRGRGTLRVTVHDLYDAEKIGTAPGVEIRVGHIG